MDSLRGGGEKGLCAPEERFHMSLNMLQGIICNDIVNVSAYLCSAEVSVRVVLSGSV